MTDIYAQIQTAAHSGAFGINGYALPTVEQCRAGNYRKGRVQLYGLNLAIETPQGTRRMGKSDGKPWSVICMAHYGDISGTIGADGDPVDCYIGPIPESDRVFVVNQNGKDGSFDEHKVMLAFSDEDSARTAYMGSYERGWTGLGSMVSASVTQFRWWLKFGNTSLPFSKAALPYDGDDDMTDITWDSAAQPVHTDLATMMYGLRKSDSDGLLLDAVTMGDIHEDADSLEILDALVVENDKLATKMGQFQRIMEAGALTVKPLAVQISEPFKQKGTTNVVALFELSDGQTVAIYFHNPDSTPNKLLPKDELVSWKWLLNKKDVTILVAPEKGVDLNPREVVRRIMRLAEKNSAKFAKANTARSERLQALETAKSDVATKESTLAALEAEIADLTPKVEAKRNIQAPQPAAHPPAEFDAAVFLANLTKARGVDDYALIPLDEYMVELEQAIPASVTGEDRQRLIDSMLTHRTMAVDRIAAMTKPLPVDPPKLGRTEWEDAVYVAIEAAFQIGRSDAQGVVEARGDQIDTLFASGASPEDAATALMASAQGNDELPAALELLQSVIDGTAELDAGLADRLQQVHDQFADNPEFVALFEKAANAFSDAMIAKTKAQLAA